MTTFRDSLLRIAGPFLQDATSQQILYPLGTILDAGAEFVTEGLLARFPGLGTPTALPYHGRDRKIVRGFAESDPAYANRLVGWLDSHRTRGNPYALMRQLQGYCSPQIPRIRTVNNAGFFHTLNIDGSTSYQRTSGLWNWDGNTAAWARFWVIIYSTASGPWATSPAWGSGNNWGNPGQTWGTTATSDQVAAVRAIISDWKPAGTRCNNIIIAFDDASFDPAGSPGPGYPGGTWGGPAVVTNGQYVASRLSSARYWDGTND